MVEMNFPQPINTTPEDDRLYLGLSRQDLKAHQAICELIDNGISACPDKEFFVIEIHIEKNGEDISIKVIDDGVGIPLNDICNKILRIGGRGELEGKLNEHGFGLKNSLCVLTGNERGFYILTRDKEAAENNLVYFVKGPFRSGMQVDKGTEDMWSENIFKCRNDTGTRVSAKTTMHYFRTLYPSATRLDTLIERLIEHLGVLYRSYLENTRNEMWIRWRDVTEGLVEWVAERVQDIQIPYTESEKNKLQFMCNGKKYTAIYERGYLDKAEVDDPNNGKPYPLKIYYQRNQKTQGIDINVRGRVIIPHALQYLWPDINRHNDLNSFVGELSIDDPAFSTVNNKTQLDPNNPVWEKLTELLDHESYKPKRTGGGPYGETELRKVLKEKLKSIVYNSSVQDDVPSWHEVGVKIDILHKIEKDNEQIYELKTGKPSPLDVYQLVMYWDARVEDGIRPSLGRLVAREENQHVLRLIEYWNSRKDKGAKNYNLEFKKIEDLI